jgi:hypothetical protein
VLLGVLVWENGGLAGVRSNADMHSNAGYGKKNLRFELDAFGLLVLPVLEDHQEELLWVYAFYHQISLQPINRELGISLADKFGVTVICKTGHQHYKKHNRHYYSAIIYGADKQFQQVCS